MSHKKSVILLLLYYFDPIISKGLYSGVPCHRPYYCIFGEVNEYHEDSVLVGEEDGIRDEKLCQYLCSKSPDCVSYTWWNEKARHHPDGRTFLCQMFAVCNRRYQNPNLTPAFSGTYSVQESRYIFDLFLKYRTTALQKSNHRLWWRRYR